MDSIGTHGEAGGIGAGPSYYVWKIPGVAVRIRISLDAVRRIREYLAAHSERSPDTEAGGLLLGKPHAPGVQIDDFAPLFRESESEPHFVFSDEQKPGLRKYITEVNCLEGGLPVIGYFRSDVRESICLSNKDLAIIQEFFPQRSNVFLVVHPGEGTPSTAGFFFWDGDAVFGSCSFMEFDFDENKLASALDTTDLDTTEFAEEPDDAVQQPHSSSQNIDAGTAKDALSRRRRSLGLGIATAMGLALGWYLLLPVPFLSSVTVPAPAAARAVLQPPPSIGLVVSRSGSDISIVWNGRAPLLAGARVGMLTIEDGGSRRDVPLTPAQLRSSQLIYTPRTGTVEIALEIFNNDGKVTRENVIAVSNSDTPPMSGPGAHPIQAIIQVDKAAPQTSKSQERQRQAVRDFVPPVVRNEPIAPVADASLQPALTAGIDAPRIDPPIVQDSPSPVPAPFRIDAPDLPARPAELQIVSQPVHRPPVPLRQVRPVLPPNVKAMLTSRSNVKVRVQVDATGKVTAVEPLASGGSLERFLGAAAASAARMWAFAPATTGQRKVPGELTLEFTFVPDSKKF